MSYRKWTYISISLFGIGMVSGLVDQSAISAIVSEDIAALEELAGFLSSLPSFMVALVIFSKNASVLLFSFVFSPILCLLPILTLTTNGWLLASVSAVVATEKSLGFVLAGILPHGILELPALIMGEAAAISFGTMAILALFRNEKRALLLPNLKQNLRYLMVALALFIPASIIETYITPLLLT